VSSEESSRSGNRRGWLEWKLARGGVLRWDRESRFRR
jgi:hypothetical protein